MAREDSNPQFGLDKQIDISAFDSGQIWEMAVEKSIPFLAFLALSLILILARLQYLPKIGSIDPSKPLPAFKGELLQAANLQTITANQFYNAT